MSHDTDYPTSAFEQGLADYERTRSVAARPVHSACYAPFTSLNLDTLGVVRACCQNSFYVLGRLGEQRLGEIWAGPRTRALRERLMAQDLSAGCDSCRRQIEHGDASLVYARLYDDLPLISSDPPWPVQLELAMSNTCNLQCVMCSGTYSSSIRAHREHAAPLISPYDDAFFADLGAFLPHLQRIKLLGGEPLLATETLRLIDDLDAIGVTPRLHITTNGTVWNARTADILDRYPTDLAVSIDAASRDLAAEIRVGSDLDLVLANVTRFRAYAQGRGTDLSLTSCLMTRNWHELFDILALGDRLDLDVFVNDVYEPTDLSLLLASPVELATITSELERRAESEPPLTRNKAVWDEQLARLRNRLASKPDLAEPAPVAVQVSARPGEPATSRAARIASGDGTQACTRFFVDRHQVLRALDPDPHDVFGIDLSSQIGAPLGEWTALLAARYGEVESTQLVEHGGEVKEWVLVLAGERRWKLVAASAPLPGADGGQVWYASLQSAGTD